MYMFTLYHKYNIYIQDHCIDSEIQFEEDRFRSLSAWCTFRSTLPHILLFTSQIWTMYTSHTCNIYPLENIAITIFHFFIRWLFTVILQRGKAIIACADDKQETVLLEFNATLTAKVISWRSVTTCVSWLSHTSTNTTFLSKATNNLSHMFLQMWEAKIRKTGNRHMDKTAIPMI